MFNPLSLFSTFKSSMITIGVVAGLSAIVMLWGQKVLAERMVLELQQEKARLENAVLAREIEVNGLKIAIGVFEDVMAKIDEHRQIEAEIEEEINNATPEQDGPVADVLRNAITGVERMYNHTRP